MMGWCQTWLQIPDWLRRRLGVGRPRTRWSGTSTESGSWRLGRQASVSSLTSYPRRRGVYLTLGAATAGWQHSFSMPDRQWSRSWPSTALLRCSLWSVSVSKPTRG